MSKPSSPRAVTAALTLVIASAKRPARTPIAGQKKGGHAGRRLLGERVGEALDQGVLLGEGPDALDGEGHCVKAVDAERAEPLRRLDTRTARRQSRPSMLKGPKVTPLGCSLASARVADRPKGRQSGSGPDPAAAHP